MNFSTEHERFILQFRSLVTVLASIVLAISCCVNAFATDKEELEKARASMKAGHCEESFNTLNTMAKRGHPAAQCLVGICYQTGRGVTKTAIRQPTGMRSLPNKALVTRKPDLERCISPATRSKRTP